MAYGKGLVLGLHSYGMAYGRGKREYKDFGGWRGVAPYGIGIR